MKWLAAIVGFFLLAEYIVERLERRRARRVTRIRIPVPLERAWQTGFKPCQPQERR